MDVVCLNNISTDDATNINEYLICLETRLTLTTLSYFV